MLKLRLAALAVALVLLLFVSRAVFSAPASQATADNLQVSAQTGFSLNIKLPDGSTLTVPVDLEIVAQIQDGTANMDVTAIVGEGDGASMVPMLDIPATIETGAVGSRGTVVELAPATATSTGIAITGTANRNGNLRQGPGTNFAVVGSVRTDDALQIIGVTMDGSWYQLANGAWIAVFLVDRTPGDIGAPTSTTDSIGPPTATATSLPPTPTNTPVPPPTLTPTSTTRPCDPSYPTICIEPGAADLDCGEISDRRFTVLQPDPHGFDGDNDGIGCES